MMCQCLLARRVDLRSIWVFILPVLINSRDLLENYPSSDCECSSHCSSLFASRIPESPLNVLEELYPAAYSPATSVLVYSRRKNLGKTKLVVDAGLGSLNM